MNKFLLFITLIFISFSQAQINTQVSNYTVCDANADGIAQFDLTIKIPEILGNLDPSLHQTTFHLTNFDAQTGGNPIYTGAPYSNSNAFSQTIWVRVINTQTSQLSFTSFNLIVNIQPNAGTDGSITVCETNTTTINLFGLISGEQTGGTWVRTSGNSGVFNAAAGTFTPAFGATTSTFSYVLTGVAPCINDSSIATVTIIPQPNAGIDGSITVCDTSSAPIDLHSVISGEQSGGQWIRTIGAGGVFNASAGIFTPTVGTTTSGFTYILSGTAPCTNDSSTVTINVTNCNTSCLPPTNLAVSSITSTSAVLSWTSQPTSNLWNVLVLPYGSPAPTAATQGVFSQSNPFIITGLTTNDCYSFYVRTNCGSGSAVFSDWSLPSTICTYDCSNNAQCPESLQLTAFLDSNTNGVLDLGETIFNSGSFVYEINNSGTPLYGYTNNGSFSIFDSNPTNIYNLSFAVNPGLLAYYSSSSTFSNITIPTGSGSNSYYFPITQLQNYTDLEVQLLPFGNPRPGFNYYNTIRYRNKGTQVMNSGTVTFTKSPTVSITSVSQTGTTPTGTGFTYDFTNLLPNEFRDIQVQLLVPTIPTVNLGDLITNSGSIEPLVGDAFPLDNDSSLSQTVVGSYDPNDKIESHGEKIDIDTFSSNDYLTYTIQFENTGSANAQFIRVEDLLNASLNPNSIEMLSSSHNYNLKRIGNQLIWNFYAINLPPTSANPTASHGYIQFKIKPTTGFAIGDIIPNKAAIYFDYNPPIITNIFETEFVQSLRTSNFDTSNFVMYPNPTNTIVQIKLQNTSETISAVKIHNILGEKIKETLNPTSSEITVDISSFPKGVYLVEITTEKGYKQIKKLVVK
jgi:uncharacterized repeat protein (TIGR01451 family)